MSAKSPAAGGTVIYMLGSLAEGVFGMVFTMVLVRLTDQEVFGAWRQFMVLANIVWNIAIFGLPRSLMYFYSIAKPEAQGAIARRTLWLAVSLGAVASVVFYFGLDIAAARFESPGLAQEALLFSSFLLLGFPTMIINPLLLAADRRKLMALTKVALALLRLAVLAGLLWFGSDLRSLLICLNVFALAQFVVILALYLKVAGPAKASWRVSLREQTRYSTDITLTSIAGQIAVEADKLIVSSSFPTARFAAYSVGARELPLIPMIPYSISDSTAPELSRLAVQEKFEEFREFWHLWIRRTALLIYPVFALVLFQYREIVTLLYTADYLEGALPFLIIGCMIPMRVTSFYQVLLNLNGSREILYASLATLISVVGLSFLLLKLYGLWGPALALTLTEYAVNAGVLLRIAKRTRLSLARVLPWGFLGKLLTLAVACGALALGAAKLLPTVPLIVQFLCYGVALLTFYVAGALAFRLVDRADLQQLRGLILH